MRINSSIITYVLIFLSSCGQANKENKKAFEFYSLVNKQIALGRPDQQKFIDKLTSSLLEVKDNKIAVIDTEELQSLFDLAKTINVKRQTNLERISEFDRDLSYKDLTMDYFISYNGLYQDEIPKAILIFGEKSEDRFERVSNLILPKLKVTKQKELLLKQAQIDFETKYEELSKN